MAKKKARENPQDKMVIDGRNMKITSGPVGTTDSVGSRIFDAFNYLIIGIISITTILPFIYVLGASFATEYELQTRPMFLIPHDVTFNAYRYIFSSSKLIRSFGNSVFITVCGTAINLFFTVTMAYAISKKHLRGRNDERQRAAEADNGCDRGGSENRKPHNCAPLRFFADAFPRSADNCACPV